MSEEIQDAEVIYETVFLVGKIENTGADTDFNAEEFFLVQDYLERKGYDVINPHTIPREEGSTVIDNFKLDIQNMLDSDIVAAIGNWSVSHDATSKLVIAQLLGQRIICINGNEKTGYKEANFDYLFEFFARYQKPTMKATNNLQHFNFNEAGKKEVGGE